MSPPEPPGARSGVNPQSRSQPGVLGPARPTTWMRRLERGGKRNMARVLSRVFRPRPATPHEVAHARVQSLLVVRQHNQMGDMVLALPALRALRRAYPDARLTFVTAPLCQELLQDHPDIDELIVYRKLQMWRPWHLLRFIRRLRALRPDLAVVMGTVSFSTTSALLVGCSGARLRVGASSRPFGSELSRAIYHLELPLGPEGVHEVEHNLAPLRAMGIAAPCELPELVPTSVAQNGAGAFLAQSFPQRGGPLVVLHPGAGKPPNIWPVERFTRVALALRNELEARLVVSEGPADAAIAAHLLQQVGGGIVRWRNDLGRSLGLLKAADVVISNDTGMAHVAAAVGAPTVVIFGPTDVERWRPAGEHVTPIVSSTGRVDDVSVDEVLAAARARLHRSGNPTR